MRTRGWILILFIDADEIVETERSRAGGVVRDTKPRAKRTHCIQVRDDGTTPRRVQLPVGQCHTHGHLHDRGGGQCASIDEVAVGVEGQRWSRYIH